MFSQRRGNPMSLCISEMRSQRLLTCLASPTPLSNARHYLSQPNLKHLANMAGLNKSKVEELLMQSQAYKNCVILSLGSLKEKHEIGY